MKTYFGVLKEGFFYKKILPEMEKLDLKVIKYFPKMRIVKFETEKKMDKDLPFFSSVEEERNDFRI